MGRVRRRTDGADRRRTRQRLTAAGLGVYRKIVPLARAYEADVLAGLTARERQALDRVVAKLTAHLQVLDAAL
jgi:DNA-binding MarR family transcriptional regulator